ncbi:MAG: fimbrillin family protein [Alistipes sp.]|nr:fimbrillin family protein [Alistipes sp.]
MKKALFILLLAAATGCHKSDAVLGPEPEGDRVTVGFALGEVGASAKPASTRADVVEEPLAVGATVRVLAFQRAAGATSADITADKYVAEATYVVEEVLADNGTKVRRLKACNVNSATGAVDVANSSIPDEIRLRADKYDFYAFTPATAIASPWKVSIAHGVDHASSCTEQVAVAPNLSGAVPVYTQTVDLNVLMRRCCRISFVAERQSTTVSKITISSAKLSKMANTPAEATLCTALPLSATNPTDISLASSIFSSVDGLQYKFAGETIVLPKSEEEFNIEMTVQFNDSGTDKVLTGEVPAMAFDPGYQYCFVLSLKGGDVTLTLVIMDWDAVYSDDLILGDWFYGAVTLGSWELSEWSTDLGDF